MKFLEGVYFQIVTNLLPLVYSPSQTLNYAACPMLRRLTHDGWEPRVATPSLYGRLFGSAAARGLAVYRQAPSLTSLAASPLDAALALLKKQVEVYDQAGVSWSETIDELAEDLGALFQKYPSHDTLAGFVIRETELDLGEEYGHARVDVLVQDAFGNYAIVDDKVKRDMEARWIAKELDKYEYDWKMNHYCWAVSEKLGVPVETYYINLITVKPRFSVTLKPYRAYVGRQRDWWEASARRLWNRMAQEDSYGEDYRPSMAIAHRNQYGPCPMTKACLDYRLDHELMAVDYIRIPHDGRS